MKSRLPGPPRARRSTLLGLSLLSACAAADVGSAAARRLGPVRDAPTGAFGAYLDGQFALSQSDVEFAADSLSRALQLDPGNTELLGRAFLADLMAGRPDAVRLARRLPDNQMAQLLLADNEVKAGNWEGAEQRFHALSHQGVTQFLQPLLIAWAQAGGGKIDAALATLRPYVEGQRFRGIYALHAAMIADFGNRAADAARLYRTAQTEFGGTNLRLAQAVASWQARQGHKAEAEQTLRAVSEGSDELSLAIPALIAADAKRPFAKASDGIAEAYLALAAALRQQDASDAALLLLRLAIDIRPDMTAARMLLAEVMEAGKSPETALSLLAVVPADDPLIGVVRLRRAGILDRMGQSETVMRDLEQLAKDYPDSPLPYAQLADALRAKSRFTDAIAAYDKAITRQGADPVRGSWPLFYARGICFERAHQWDKSEADLQRALQLSPEQPFVLNYLGYSWADQGTHLSRAKQMIERAAELKPNDGSITDSLGWVKLRQGDAKDAVQTLERAVELEPEDATINGHLGDAYMAVGRKREAEFQWRRALTLNPEPEEAARYESRLHEVAGADGASTTTGAATTERHVQ